MLITDLDYYVRSSNFTSDKCGLDDPKFSHNPVQSWKESWHDYPLQNFDYRFNSWGFRGEEYDQYIGQPVIICLGDSFTVNIGGPVEHSWCNQLGKHFPIPTLNLGMDGAGNDAIAMLYYRACDLFDVQFTFIMYSFFHRRLKEGKFFDQAVKTDRENFDHFQINRIPNAIECALPGWCYTESEKDFLRSESIYYFRSSYNENFADYQDCDRKYINKNSYENLAGPTWPKFEDFVKGAEPHPDMLTEQFGNFVGNGMHTSRDGFHLNYDANKNYANYLYKQWSLHES